MRQADLLRLALLILVIALADRAAVAQLSTEFSLNLEGGAKVAGETQVRQVQGLNNGAIVGGPSKVAAFTNDFALNGDFRPPPTACFPFAVLPDGQIITNFKNPRGPSDTNSFPCVVKLNWRGEIDPTFNAPQVWNGDNDYFTCTAIQPDGKILVGGYAERGSRPRPSYAGPLNIPRPDGMFRLNPDGSLDFAYNDFGVKCLIILADGKILLGGQGRVDFPDGYYSQGVGRLLPDGQPDSTFSVKIDGPVNSLALQRDGKIVIVGTFFHVNSSSWQFLARLLANGLLDTSLQLNHGFDESVAIQADGKIITSGQGLIRLNPDGSNDLGFSMAFTNPNYGLSISPEGRILTSDMAGGFWQFSGQFRVNVPSTTVPIVLERATSLNSTWSTVQSIPANTPSSYPDYNYPGSQNAFYRVRPAR